MAILDIQIRELLAMHSQLHGEFEELRSKLTVLEMALSSLGYGISSQEDEDEPKLSVKTTLLTLLEEAGAKGLNSSLAIQKASRRGIKLERGSVSSTLSRLKREGIAIYDGERYRLKDYVNMGFSAAGEHMASA